MIDGGDCNHEADNEVMKMTVTATTVEAMSHGGVRGRMCVGISEVGGGSGGLDDSTRGDDDGGCNGNAAVIVIRMFNILLLRFPTK